DYTVRFYKNGALLEEVAGEALAADAVTTFTVTDTPVVTDPETCEYYAEVVFAADEDTTNNTGNTALVRVVVSEYPTVADLAGEYNDGIKLTWSDPDMSTLPQVSVTETFENYESFIIDNIGQWGVYDGDGERTVILATEYEVLDYPHIGEAMAWQVFDPEEAGVLLSAWYARSGKKMLVSFQASRDNNRKVVSNDWLISPELSGNEQTVSFYACAGMSGSYAPELFDFMISKDSNKPEDFEALDIDRQVPYNATDWTEFSFRVPAGTRYFAIVHKSYDKVAMLVDDITYVPAGSPSVQLDLQGFNVYRDGARINSELVADTEYLDTDVELGHDYTYNVTAVWDKGESKLSEAVTIKAESAVEGVGSYELTIRPLTGAIRIEGGVGEDVAVYTTAGVCVAIVKAQGVVDVPVTPGIYLVKAPAAVAKVVVR
ncbi:MAG: choice-of-anchor J domain-containing protein, partial [Muribaculaceae bacterium]|nr:choice-of-anchor J domain-containing protein [Muribaculaceae bacterium]